MKLSAPDILPNVDLPLADREAVQVVKHDWRVAHRLSLWLQADGGNLKPAADFMFGRGDFVEVTVFADIVSYWDTKAGKARAEIQYAPEQVVRLRTAKQVKLHLLPVLQTNVLI